MVHELPSANHLQEEEAPESVSVQPDSASAEESSCEPVTETVPVENVSTQPAVEVMKAEESAPVPEETESPQLDPVKIQEPVSNEESAPKEENPNEGSGSPEDSSPEEKAAQPECALLPELAPEPAALESQTEEKPPEQDPESSAESTEEVLQSSVEEKEPSSEPAATQELVPDSEPVSEPVEQTELEEEPDSEEVSEPVPDTETVPEPVEHSEVKEGPDSEETSEIEPTSQSNDEVETEHTSALEATTEPESVLTQEETHGSDDSPADESPLQKEEGVNQEPENDAALPTVSEIIEKPIVGDSKSSSDEPISEPSSAESRTESSGTAEITEGSDPDHHEMEPDNVELKEETISSTDERTSGPEPVSIEPETLGSPRLVDEDNPKSDVVNDVEDGLVLSSENFVEKPSSEEPQSNPVAEYAHSEDTKDTEPSSSTEAITEVEAIPAEPQLEDSTSSEPEEVKESECTLVEDKPPSQEISEIVGESVADNSPEVVDAASDTSKIAIETEVLLENELAVGLQVVAEGGPLSEPEPIVEEVKEAEQSQEVEICTTAIEADETKIEEPSSDKIAVEETVPESESATDTSPPADSEQSEGVQNTIILNSEPTVDNPVVKDESTEPEPQPVSRTFAFVSTYLRQEDIPHHPSTSSRSTLWDSLWYSRKTYTYTV